LAIDFIFIYISLPLSDFFNILQIMIPTWLYELAIKIADQYDKEQEEKEEKEQDEINSLWNSTEDDRGNPIY
jgi:hypothetical protein